MVRTLVPVAAAFFALAPLARAAVSVKVARVEETRVKELQEDPNQGAMLSQVTLTLRLAGAEVAGASEYSTPEITEAVDDTGASLKPEQSVGSDMFMPLQSSMFPRSDQQSANPPVDVRVSINAPERKATKLSRVKGEVRVKAGGQKKVVTVSAVKDRVGKRVDDPALKAARLTATVVDPRAEGKEDNNFGFDPLQSPGGVSVKIVGDSSIIKQLDVVGADGQSVSQGRSSFGSGNTTVHTVMLDRAPDASMSLTIELLAGQKVVRVPFDLKDVPLP